MAVKNDQVEALACPKPVQPCATVASETVPLCESQPVTPTVVNTNKFVIGKIPVVLAELDVQIDLFATITLPTPAVEIKRIKKRLKLTQCRLIQNTNKLFLEGFVRKNVEFATAETCVATNSICGQIHQCILDVPFRCVTEIEEFITEPRPALPSTSQEFEFLASTPLPTTEFPEKDTLMAGDLSEFNQESMEFFNELPFCELISSTITEFDEFINRVPIVGGPFEERTFTEFDEKSVIRLTFKVLQNQQVCIPPSTVCTC
ncbi:MAG TPA: hypothetical protein DCZ10_07120 [Pelotomaculum sp.]|nr:hypothetical protein [Pelotomaculum sp.]